MTTIADVKLALTGMMHGGTLNKVRNIGIALERAANTMLAHIAPIETERLAALSTPVFDDIFNYSLPSDFGRIIDLRPQDTRTNQDTADRRYAEMFDLKKFIENKRVSIESREGTMFIRINWRSRSPKRVHSMDSRTANGTWSAVGSASTPVADTLFKVQGSGSLRFNVVASGDGLQNTTFSNVDLTTWDELADFFMWLYFPSISNLTSVTVRWGNDLTANYWQSAAQTAQADSTAFKAGWNLFRFPWNTATETGTVAPATIDSFRFIITSAGAISNVRADDITVALGRNFDLAYYSRYAFQNSSGTWLRRPTAADDSDSVVFEGTAFQIFILESLKAIAQQVEGEDSSFDIVYANRELNGDSSSPDPVQRMGLYAKYRAEHPDMSKKSVTLWHTPRNPNLRYR